MKFAILFCVVALACVAQAETDVATTEQMRSAFIAKAKAKLEAAKQKIDELIEKASDLLKEKINQAKDKAQILTDKLKHGATKVNDKIYATIKVVLDTFNGKVEKLNQYAASEGVDINECTAMTETLREAALAIIANSSLCLNEKIERGQDLLSDISSKYEEALLDIKGIKDDASECLKNIDGIKAAASAAGCVTIAGAKAYWALAKKVPAVAFDITKITYLISTLPPSVAFCMSKNSIVTFYQQSSEVFTSIKTCVNEKFSEAKGIDFPEFPELPEFPEVPEEPEIEKIQP